MDNEVMNRFDYDASYVLNAAIYVKRGQLKALIMYASHFRHRREFSLETNSNRGERD
jgi:hypothetical protein